MNLIWVLIFSILLFGCQKSEKKANANNVKIDVTMEKNITKYGPDEFEELKFIIKLVDVSDNSNISVGRDNAFMAYINSDSYDLKDHRARDLFATGYELSIYDKQLPPGTLVTITYNLNDKAMSANLILPSLEKPTTIIPQPYDPKYDSISLEWGQVYSGNIIYHKNENNNCEYNNQHFEAINSYYIYPGNLCFPSSSNTLELNLENESNEIQFTGFNSAKARSHIKLLIDLDSLVAQ